MVGDNLPQDTTRKLARWVSALRFEDLPSEVVAAAKLQILDMLAVAWAGSKAESVDPVRTVIAETGGAPQSRVWCYGDRLPATQAAFVNGMLAAALDFDTLHDRANVHSDGVVLPAVWALAEARGASGAELITALVAGGELMVRLGLAARSAPGWFYSSVFGAFGAAAAAANLLRLTETQTLHAMGIALSQASGTQQPLLERSLTKRLQTAYAARQGVEAALLAEAGVTGPAQPLEGLAGIGALYTELDGSLLEGLGERYDSLGMTFKKFASCMCNHAPIEAALRLRAGTGAQPADIESAMVTISPFMHRLTGARFTPGDNPQVSAQFNVRYSVASALLRGRFESRDIEPAAVRDAGVLELASRVEVRVDERAGRFGPARLDVRWRGTGVHSVTVHAPPGTPDNPLPEAEILAKARTAFTQAAIPLSASAAGTLIRTLQSLERCPRVSALLDSSNLDQHPLETP
jgi:2-methylcitrate dehydratase PrpD